MAEVDTSSYPRAPALPVQKSAIEQMGQYQNLERGNVALSSEKLGLINTQFQLINSELANLAATPGISKEQAAQKLTTFANTYKFPPDVSKHMIDELNQAPDVKSFAENAMRRGMDVNTKINQTYGTPASASDNATMYTGVTKPTMQGGGFVPATQAPLQVPPTQEVQNPDLSKRLVGPSGAPGFTPSLPVAAPVPNAAAPLPQARPSLPVSGPIGPSVSVGTEFNNRFPTSAPPGVEEARKAVAAQGGISKASDLTRAKTLQEDLFPMNQTLEIADRLGPQGFGPGTDGLNKVKSAIATWLPNVDEKTLGDIKDYESAKKYMVQAARAAGNTGTNDQLAAAFDATPNATMNSATIQSVIKSNIALRKMQAGLTMLGAKVPPEEYGSWYAKNQNVLDPRAFGFDIMDKKAQEKLLDGFTEKDSDSPEMKAAKAKAWTKFKTSLQFAKDAELIGQ